MLWLVSGPSSVGKSVFIKSERFKELTGLRTSLPVLLPKALASQSTSPPGLCSPL